MKQKIPPSILEILEGIIMNRVKGFHNQRNVHLRRAIYIAIEIRIFRLGRKYIIYLWKNILLYL